MNVVRRHTITNGVASRGVVRDDAAHCCAVRRRWVRTEEQSFCLQDTVEVIKDNAWFNRDTTCFCVQIEDGIKMFGHVHDDRAAYRLTGSKLLPAARAVTGTPYSEAVSITACMSSR